MNRTHARVGLHVLLDMWGSGCFDCKKADIAVMAAINSVGAILLQRKIHRFPGGAAYTAMYLLAESHVTLHFWPELDYLSADIFMCGTADAEAASSLIIERLQPRHFTRHSVSRGLL